MASMAWLRVPVEEETGVALKAKVKERSESLLASSELTRDEMAYISKLSLGACEDVRGLSHEQLEKVRRLCQLWEVKLRPRTISSHRPILGKFIVAAKTMFFRLMEVLLRDAFRQQRDFNAATISLLTEISARQNSKCNLKDS